MDRRDYFVILYDYYGSLLNDKQREYFEYYYFDNLSLQEISDNLSVSRNAIHKTLKNVLEKLEFYEANLELYQKKQKFENIVNDIADEELKNKLRELF